mgnify:CR=1 FL=1
MAPNWLAVARQPEPFAMEQNFLAPEGTFPVLYELLARGVAVYVADLRIQMPSPSVDEPVTRILTEMDAGVNALKDTGTPAASLLRCSPDR